MAAMHIRNSNIYEQLMNAGHKTSEQDHWIYSLTCLQLGLCEMKMGTPVRWPPWEDYIRKE